MHVRRAWRTSYSWQSAAGCAIFPPHTFVASNAVHVGRVDVYKPIVRCAHAQTLRGGNLPTAKLPNKRFTCNISYEMGQRHARQHFKEQYGKLLIATLVAEMFLPGKNQTMSNYFCCRHAKFLCWHWGNFINVVFPTASRNPLCKMRWPTECIRSNAHGQPELALEHGINRIYQTG